MDIAQFIKEKIALAVKKSYDIDLNVVHLEHPENRDHGDYSTNVAMHLAKLLKQSPITIANKISYEIQELDPVLDIDGESVHVISKVEVASPGFINIKLSNMWLQSVLFDITQRNVTYGSSNLGKNKRIALEHSNANPNKAVHIGHLRNACLGQFIERTFEFLGYQVEVQYYANDVGVQVATLTLGQEYVKDLDPTKYKKFDHYAWDVYSRMESAISNDPELLKARERLTIELDDPESAAFKSQRELADRILKTQLQTFSNLGIDYDVIIHESDILATKLWDKAFELLKVNPHVYFSNEGKSKGCWLMKVSKDTPKEKSDDLDIEEDKILVRSNGVPTYTAKDIAYHMWKFGLMSIDFSYKITDYGTQSKTLYETTSRDEALTEVSFTGADVVLDVVGGEQTYAMDVVKKSLGFLGYKTNAEEMTHINYGFVYLSPETASALGIDISEGKDRYGMSGRKGWGIKIDDFIDMVDKKLVLEFGASASVSAVRNSVIKFEMLKYNTFIDMVFDLNSALNIKGFSGPYLLYTFARANSVLYKANYEYDESLLLNDVSIYSNKGFAPEELAILRMLYRFPEVVCLSAQEFSPSTLCTYMFEVSKLFNNFYAKLPIKNADDVVTANFRLFLTSCVTVVLKNGMNLLGIDSVEKM